MKLKMRTTHLAMLVQRISCGDVSNQGGLFRMHGLLDHGPIHVYRSKSFCTSYHMNHGKNEGNSKRKIINSTTQEKTCKSCASSSHLGSRTEYLAHLYGPNVLHTYSRYKVHKQILTNIRLNRHFSTIQQNAIPQKCLHMVTSQNRPTCGEGYTCSCGNRNKIPAGTGVIIRSASTLTFDDNEAADSEQVCGVLKEHDMAYEQGYTCYITTCPKHTKRKLKLREVDKLYINKTTGYFVCHSCKKSGSWSLLQDNIQSIMQAVSEKKRHRIDCFGDIDWDESDRDSSKAFTLWQSCVPLNDVSEDEVNSLLEALKIQHLNISTLQQFSVLVLPDFKGLALPWFSVDGTLKGVKVMSYKLTEDGKIKTSTRTIPKVDYTGIFGMNIIRSDHREIVLTASEFDAMVVRQCTKMSAIALPKGDSILPQQALPVLEQFQKIILWLGGDQQTWENTKRFATKLDEKRCHLIRPDKSHPSAYTALQQGLNLPAILGNAKPIKHKSIINFHQLRRDVHTEILQAEQISGVKWKRYPKLNQLLKGHRQGELTVFTGPTGSGKTTFISEYSLDLCMQGVNTLWGSFEINNVRLLRTMLMQYAQSNLMKDPSTFESWADKFEQLQMYFMTFHGQENVTNVIETMSHAVYVHDIAHVVVDNLQFMMGSGNRTAADRFLQQDDVIGAFRKFATNKNCHVTLVIHPRKERDSDDLTVSSIFGGAKASQEADNILILQDKRLTSIRGRKYVQVAKNRFDGELGIVLLKFDKESLSFSSKAEKDKSATKAEKDKSATKAEKDKSATSKKSPGKIEDKQHEQTEADID